MHEDLGRSLYNPEYRYVACKMFRGSAKTTVLRTFTSQRIAYAVSRTIMYVGPSQSHSVYSIRWLKRQIQYNKHWASTFGLRPGSKWTDEWIEIYHGVDDVPITVLAVGITGQLRGINIDDFRPDLIVVDDPCDLENTATPEQRGKISELFFGALQKSLAPATEAANAKMVLLQTPLQEEDLIEQCMKDPEWHPIEYSCFDQNGRSRWEGRFPTEVLQKEKAAHIQRNQLALWMREMEVKVVRSEKMAFNLEWLRHWEVLPDGMVTIIAIDPASSDNPKADEQAVVVLGFHKQKVYLLDYATARGEMPDELCNKLFEFNTVWHPLKVVVEKVGYQRVLAWYIEREMKARRVWFQVEPLQDRRAKPDRIIQAFAGSGLAPYGNFYCRETHTKFKEQFGSFAPDIDQHDDILDAIAMGLMSMGAGLDLEGEYERIEEDEERAPQLEHFRSCP